MTLALDRLNRMVSEGGEPLLDAMASASFGALVLVLALLVLSVELWIISIKVSVQGSRQARFWSFFLPFPIVVLAVRLLSVDGWAAAAGWAEPTLANLALAGFDVEGGQELADTQALEQALAFVVSGRAGQILIPCLLVSLLGLFLVRQYWPTWRQSKTHALNLATGALLLFMFAPPLMNGAAWGAFFGNTQAFEDQLTTDTTRPLRLPASQGDTR